jgi:serine/threonine protein kinase
MMRPQPHIPDLEVIRQIGSGAYGEVWLAKSLTGAWRAVKVVYREDFKDEQTFLREFEGVQHYEPISRIHPGLVQILHVGKHDGDCPFYYYVMELADDAYSGTNISPIEYTPRTLRSDLRLLESNHPMNWDYCLEVGCQLSRALIYLHSKGLIHRDIKPSNVVFVDNHPKLADIGLVSHNDQTGYVGTEGYIPPEGPGSNRADVYA